MSDARETLINSAIDLLAAADAMDPAPEDEHYNHLIITTMDMMQLLRAAGLTKAKAAEITARAFHEYNVTKEAHWNHAWAARGDGSWMVT